MFKRTLTAAAAASIAFAAPAMAQQQNGLINVNLEDINVELKNILSNNDIAIPVSVQVPIGIAANVCGTTVALLQQDLRNGDNTCEATTANAALARIVAKNDRKSN
jgi:hypothetical protein